jgi:2-polyprenyl-3-methyl-5-hydroxy-6-metoxy-1,4-benzoquinol methylase
MSDEMVRQLDTEALALFAKKGHEGGPKVAQGGLANGVKVRRIMQLTADLARRPFAQLRILDLGCGEGVYSIEAALRGAQVVALDARTQRMERGAACARRHGLDNLRFIQQDVRMAKREALGSFDVVYLLGAMFHSSQARPPTVSPWWLGREIRCCFPLTHGSITRVRT